MSEPRSLPVDPDALLRTDAFVRRIARSLVADSAAAEDIAQQAWLVAIEHPPGGDVPLHAWFTTIVRRAASRLRRTIARRHEREQVAARPEVVPAASEYRERELLRRAVVDAVFALDEPYKTTLLLRFLDDLPPRKVAERMNVAVETVRTRVKRGLELLRTRLDVARGGDRAAWVALMLPLARGRDGIVAGAVGSLVTGGLLVPLHSKIVGSVAAVVIATALVWWAIDDRKTADTATSTAGEHAAAPAVVEIEPPDSQRAAVAATRATEERASPSPQTVSTLLDATGGLDVRVVDEHGTPIADVVVIVEDASSRAAVGDPISGITGSDGFCCFDRIAVGPVLVGTDRNRGERGRVSEGSRTDVIVRLDSKEEDYASPVAGVVVDGDGAPFEDAEIVVATSARMGSDPPCEPREVARTDGDGRFLLPRVGYGTWVSARAPGFVPSSWSQVPPPKDDHSRFELRLVLSETAGSVVGSVVDTAGAPIAGALVLFGDELRSRLEQERDAASGMYLLRRLSLLARSDADGRFLLEGMAPGREPVHARAPGFAPWVGSIEIHEGEAQDFQIEMTRGSRIEGFVRDASGTAVAGAEIRVGPQFRFASTLARSREDGSFRVDGLAAGTTAVQVIAKDRGRRSGSVDLAPGDTVRWDAVLDAGGTIRGTLRTESGAPLGRWTVEARGHRDDPNEPEQFVSARSDEQGKFVLEQLATTPFDLQAFDAEHHAVAAASRRGVEPGGPGVDIVVPNGALASAELVGSIRGATGEVVADCEIFVGNQDAGSGSRRYTADPATGRFTIGPLPPGHYFFRAQAPGFPPIEKSGIELTPNGRTDLGELQFTAASLVLKLRGDHVDLHGAQLEVQAAGGFRRSAPVSESVARIDGLPVGRCFIGLSGPAIAAQTFELTLASGTTEHAVDVVAGVPLVLHFLPPSTPPSANVIPGAGISSGGSQRLLLRASLVDIARAPFHWSVCLAPGTYTVSVFLVFGPTFEQALVVRADDARDRVVEIKLP